MILLIPLLQVWYYSCLLSITLLHIPLTAMQHINMYSAFYSTKDQNLFQSCIGLLTNLLDFEILQYITSRMVSNLLKLEYLS